MTRRTERVTEAIRCLAGEIVHNQLKDPRISGVITVTRVEVTPDLRLAKIYYSVWGDDRKKGLIAQGLKSAKNFIRKRIGDELKLRYAPDILLLYDEHVEADQRIEKILDKLHKEVEGENRPSLEGQGESHDRKSSKDN